MILREKGTGVIFGDGFLALDEKGAHTSYSVMTGVSPETHELIEGSLPPTKLDDAGRISSQWASVRATRNAKLAASDWTQLADAPLTSAEKAEWATRRQAWRDITNQADPFNLVWPDE